MCPSKKSYSLKYSPYHNYNDKGTEKLYRWNHFQIYFFQLMNDKNIDPQ